MGCVSHSPDLPSPSKEALEAVYGQVSESGLRLTQPRRRILSALLNVGHATPEQLTASVNQDGETPLPASTVYRNLEALASADLVRHTHLDHGAPSFNLPHHGEHLHLVCRECGAVIEADHQIADDFVRNLWTRFSFEADVTHMAIHGRCRDCQALTTERPS
ncbi:Fur family transcriptional regulator [Ornithinimicrobium sp. INDO-MA30-4]|uniref:Fur family transcriptional regulator n=1 Tax=Ornithinimicrobium sp. INDO-MA30-4 TaxID=2908651 RepID=UPI0037CC804F